MKQLVISHLASTVREQRKVDAGAEPSFSFLPL